jgi:hypothetical protein
LNDPNTKQMRAVFESNTNMFSSQIDFNLSGKFTLKVMHQMKKVLPLALLNDLNRNLTHKTK